jgi:hypothetical protein
LRRRQFSATGAVLIPVNVKSGRTARAPGDNEGDGIACRDISEAGAGGWEGERGDGELVLAEDVEG